MLRKTLGRCYALDVRMMIQRDSDAFLAGTGRRASGSAVKDAGRCMSNMEGGAARVAEVRVGSRIQGHSCL